MAITRPEALRAGAAASGAALLMVAVAANAATSPPLQPTLAFSTVATDNAELTADANSRTDLIGDLDVGVIVRSHGGRVTLTGDAGLEFIGYARHSEPDRVLPRGKLDMKAILVDHLLFFDGDLTAARRRSDPLGAQSDSSSTANTVSSLSLRASPYLTHDFSSTLNANARADTIVTRYRTDDASGVTAPNGSTYQRDTVSLVRTPTPVGVSVDFAHEDTKYQDAAASALRSNLLQATLDTAINGELVLGLVGGRENAVYAGVNEDDTTYGGLLKWHPSKRLALEMDAEHHYYGTGWNLHFRDRMPRTVVDLTLSRSSSGAAGSFGVTSPDSDPAALLGALLSSRAPEAADSDIAVDTLVQASNLPRTFSQPLQISSESPQLATRAAFNLIHAGVRNTLYASAWYLKADALPSPTPGVPATTFDSRQWGGSLGLYHRLSPEMSAAAEVDWSTLEALGTRRGDSQRQVTGTLSLTRRLGPRTSLSCGLRHFNSRVVLNSTSTTTDVRENQAFAGLRVQY